MHRIGSQRRLHEIFFPQHLVEREASIFVLRRKGTTAKQIAGAAAHCVPCNPFPQHVQRGGVPEFFMEAGSAEFENLTTNLFEGAEIEELLPVVSEVSLGAVP